MFILIFNMFFMTKIRDQSFVALLPLRKEQVGKDCRTDFFYTEAENILFNYIYRFEEVKHNDHRNTLWF